TPPSKGEGSVVPSAPLLLSALVDRGVVAAGSADVELTRTADLLLGILDHLLPLRDPADRAGHRKQDREHRGREAEGTQRDPRVEVDVRVELLLDEVVVLERNALQLQGHLEQTLVFEPERVENL